MNQQLIDQLTAERDALIAKVDALNTTIQHLRGVVRVTTPSMRRTLTHAEIQSVLRGSGFTKGRVDCLGLTYPMPRGWLKRDYTESQIQAFLTFAQ